MTAILSSENRKRVYGLVFVCLAALVFTFLLSKVFYSEPLPFPAESYEITPDTVALSVKDADRFFAQFDDGLSSYDGVNFFGTSATFKGWTYESYVHDSWKEQVVIARRRVPVIEQLQALFGRR